MRYVLFSTSVLLATLSGVVGAQAKHAQGDHPSPRSTDDHALIANALRAAPPSLSAGATVVGHDGRVVRKGTSDWVCMPDMPNVPNDSPMCLDASWRAFIDAWMNKRDPQVTRVGFGYMLQGDMPVSNNDPFATAPTPTNAWLADGVPHIMILLPDAALLDSLPTDPHNGGPWVMWKGTKYAHVMVPTTRREK